MAATATQWQRTGVKQPLDIREPKAAFAAQPLFATVRSTSGW